MKLTDKEFRQIIDWFLLSTPTQTARCPFREESQAFAGLRDWKVCKKHCVKWWPEIGNDHPCSYWGLRKTREKAIELLRQNL